MSDEHWMRQALALAQQAAAQGEVPVGALLVREGRVLAQGWNRPIALHDPTAHAEMLTLRQATARIGNYRLPFNTSLYVTLEPCVMCLGAIVQARVARVVYAASDPRVGAGMAMAGDTATANGHTTLANGHATFDLLLHRAFNHRPVWQGGVLAEEATCLLQAFFRARR